MQARQADIAPTIGKYSRAARAGDLFFISGTTSGGTDAVHGAGLDGHIWGILYSMPPSGRRARI